MKVHTRRGRAGFSLTELLVVIGIMAVLMAVAVPSVIHYQRRLKLTELDDNARAVFVAAQNHLTALRSATVDGLEVGPTAGRNAKEAMTVDGTQFWYVATDVSGAEPGWLVLPGSIESDLAQGSYLVEFDPASGGVYGVFFMEKTGGQALSQSTYDAARAANCRTREGREKFLNDKGIYLGYYGADGEWNVTRPDLQKLPKPKLELVNAEELKLTLRTDLEDWPADADKVFASVSVSDGSRSKMLVKEGRLPKGSAVSMVLDTLDTGRYSQNEKPNAAGWDKVGGSFAQWVADGSGGYVIAPGTDITVTVSIFYKDGGTGIAALPQTASVTTNSLFAARSGSRVDVAYGRHLQNLDLNTSHLDSAITAAVQTREIDFEKTGGGVYAWADTYASRPFVPVTNAALDSYKGGGRPIRNLNAVKASGQYENAGLFGVFSGTLLEKVTLVDVRATGANAGALAGTVQNADGVVVDGCQVYLTRYSTAASRVRGSSYAGGMIGKAENLTTQSGCFASTVVSGYYVGGLVGGGSKMYVSRSYAAGHLSGTSVGGLVGWGSATSIQNCYAAGTIASATQAAGGLSAGSATTRTSYAAVDYGELAPTVNVYGAVPSGAQLSSGKVAVHYLVKLGVNDKTTAENVAPITGPDKLKNRTDLGLGTQFDNGNDPNVMAQPYNLPNQADGTREPQLAAPYPYPTLNVGISPNKTSVPHYGDWLEGSALRGVVAYYEQYETGSALKTDFFYYELSGEGTLETKGSLNATGTLYSDGYAFLSLNQLHEEGQSVVPMMVAIGADAEMKEYSTTYLGTYEDGLVTYYAYGLPNSALDAAVAASDYFLQLRVAGLDSSAELSSLWLNPHFGKTAYNGYGETNPSKSTVHKVPVPDGTGDVIPIRSVRQFNNMRKYPSDIKSWTQELDMDASAYRGHQTVDGEGYLTVGGLRVTTRQSDGTWKPVKAAALPGNYRLAMPPIAMNYSSTTFGGAYDGGGHTIRNLSIGSHAVGASEQYAALFYRLAGSATLKNIRLTQCDVTGVSGGTKNYVGALVGYTEGTVLGCSVEEVSIQAPQTGNKAGGFVGGLVGYVRKGAVGSPDGPCQVVNCVVDGGGASYVGGFAGGISEGTVQHAGVRVEGEDLEGLYKTKSVTGRDYAGGFAGAVGHDKRPGTVQYCYAAVKVSGVTAGGFAGTLTAGTVSNCYAGGHTQNGVYLPSVANVSATGSAGGFAGTWSGGSLDGLCYTTCGVSGQSKADVFAVASGKSVPTGCYAGGDVFLGGSAVQASGYNSAQAIIGTLPGEGEATQAAAHPYDTTLPNKYPYKPIVVGDAPMDHYGDWTQSKGSGNREWLQDIPKSEQETLSNLTADATWTDKELTLDILIDVPGLGHDQDLHNAPGKPLETEWGSVNQGVNGIYCITTDLGYKFIFRVNADGTIDSLAGDQLKVERVDLGVQADGNRDIRWTISIPNEFIPPYVDHINFGSMISDDYTLTNIKNNHKGVDHLGDTETITIDGDFSDWLGYEHQVLEGRPAGSDTPVYGHTTGSILGTQEDIFFHLVSDNAAHWTEPYEGMSFDRFYVLVGGEMRTWRKDGTELPCSWWNAFRTLTYHEGQNKYTITYNCPCQKTVSNEWWTGQQWAMQPIDVAELYVSVDPETKHQEYEMRIDLGAWMTINLYENKLLDDLDAALKDGAREAKNIDKVKWKWYGSTVELIATRDLSEKE